MLGGYASYVTIGQMTRCEIVQMYRQEIDLLADAGPRSLWYTGGRRPELDGTHRGAGAQSCLSLQ